VLAGNIATFAWPRYRGYIWIGVKRGRRSGIDRGQRGFGFPEPAAAVFDVRDGDGLSAVLRLRPAVQHGVRPFRDRAMDGSVLADLFHVFLLSGRDVVRPAPLLPSGLGITVLTLIGYFFVDGGAFLLWMAAVNGGGLILGGSLDAPELTMAETRRHHPPSRCG